MPGGDRTGPSGQGPMTGRAAGYCAGYDLPGTMNRFPIPHRDYGCGSFGRGLAFRRGAGWGHGRMAQTDIWPRVMSRPNIALPAKTAAEMAILRTRAEDLAAELKELQQRLALLTEPPPENKKQGA